MINKISSGVAPRESILTTKEQLLVAALAYDQKYEQPIHSLYLYGFIQSHLANKSHEHLQNILENDFENWQRHGRGFYSLTQIGFNNTRLFTAHRHDIPKGVYFTFSKAIGKIKISVVCDPETRRYTPLINDKEHKPTSIIENIRQHTFKNIPQTKTSLPRQILNWILSDNDYSWSIEIIKPL